MSTLLIWLPYNEPLAPIFNICRRSGKTNVWKWILWHDSVCPSLQLIIFPHYNSNFNGLVFRKIVQVIETDDLNCNGYFVIVLTSSLENYYDTVHNMLLNCWKLHVPNVVILVPTQNYNRILLYTYFPYSEEHCEEVKPILRNYFENDSFQLSLTHFPEKCQNFHQCALHVAATNDPPYTFIPDDTANTTTNFTGLDALVIGEISHRLNFKMIVLPYNGEFQYYHVIVLWFC